MADETIRVKIQGDIEEFVNGTREAIKVLKDLKNQEAKSSGKLKADQAILAANKKKIADNKIELGLNKQLNAQRKKRIATLTEENRVLGNKNKAVSKSIKQQQGLLAVNKKETAGAQENLAGIQKKTDYLENLSKPSLRYALYDVSRTLQRTALAFAALSAVPIGFAIKYEREFANVIRTNELAGDSAKETKKALLDSLRDIAQATPVPWQDITNIATLAGQLGIATNLVADFTETVAKFSATTDLSVDAAATGFGRLNQLIDGVDGQFEELGSAILAVGVDSVATESAIVNVSTNIASMGNLAGLTASDIVGLSGAIASLGIRPELARGNITRLFSNINKSVAISGYNLEEYGRLTGRTATEFADAWSSEPTEVLLDFFKGIQAEGRGAERTLRDLGITSVRDIPAILRLAQSQDEVRRLVELSNDAFSKGTKINEQYSIIAGTTAEELKRLTQNFATLGATVGESSGAGGPIAMFVRLLNEGLSGLTSIAETDIGKGLSFFVVTLSALLAIAFAVGSAVALLTAGLSALIFTSKTAGVNINAFGLKAIFTGQTIKTLAFRAGIADASLKRLGRTAKLTGLAFGFVGIGLTALGLAFDVANQAQARASSLTDELIGSNESLRKAIKEDTEAYREGEDVLASHTKFVEKSAKATKFTIDQTRIMAAGMENLGNSTSYSIDELEKFIAVGDRVVDSLVKQARQSENFRDILQNQSLRDLVFEPTAEGGSGGPTEFFEQAIGDPEVLIQKLKKLQEELKATATSVSSTGQFDLVTQEELNRAQGLIDLITGIGGGDLFFDQAAEDAAVYNEEIATAAERTALADGQISQFAKTLFGTINKTQAAADGVGEFYAALENGENVVDISSEKFQKLVTSIAATGDPQQAIANLVAIQDDLAQKGLLTAAVSETIADALIQLAVAGRFANNALEVTPELLAELASIGASVLPGLTAPLDGYINSANGAAEATKTLAEEFDELLDSIFAPVNAAQDAAESIYDLGVAYTELGENAFYASNEIQDAVSGILESSGSAEEGVANLNALYAQLAATVGSDTAPSLAFLRNVIDQVSNEFGVAQESVAGFANIDLGFFTSGLREVSEEVRTLLDYSGDLESVISRAFDIRFASTFEIDKIAEAWFDLGQNVEDATKEIEDLIVTQEGLNADRSLKEYFLSIADAYGDTLRAGILREELSALNKEQEDNASAIAEAQAIAGGDLTGQGPGQRQNRSALLGLVGNYQSYITTLAESGASQDELRKATERARKEFIAQALELGYQEDVVLQYAEAFDDVKTAIDRVPRNITVDANTNPAIQALNELNAKLTDSINLAARLNQITNQGIQTADIPPGTPAVVVPIRAGGSESTNLAALYRRLGVDTRTGSARRMGAAADTFGFKAYASGGYTGAGGKYQPAGVVHRGEYVVPSQYVNQSSGLPNANFLSQLQNGMPGYANGGFVGGGMGDGTMMVELSPFDRKLLADAGNVQLRVNGKVVAEATNQNNFNEARRGSN